jgi:hypothetical protein
MNSCDIENSCSKAYPYPFTEFPIFIFNDNPEGVGAWQEVFPEAQPVTDIDSLIIGIATDLSNRGALIIRASTFSTVCRDLILNLVTSAVKVSSIKGYSGFYVDDFFNIYPLTTEIVDITPRQILQTASNVIVPIVQRSYWISTEAAKNGCSNFEAQFYPAILTLPPPFPIENTFNPWILIIIGIILLIGIFFWLACLIS